jgi:pSer/pThr/pTyr-binding forkhead associated (FHA) protein
VAFTTHDFSFAEVTEQLEADAHGEPYLLYRDEAAVQRILPLGGRQQLTIGRLAGSDLALAWDEEISRAHAQLERVGEEWTVLDDGLSRNGTFVNAQRVLGRHRLRDRDVLRFGQTEALFREPLEHGSDTTPSAEHARVAHLSESQRRVLVALCRPVAFPGAVAAPASNPEIARELFLSVEAVRTHLKTLFQRFEVPDLPQNQKRAELARRALASGVVGHRDLRSAG